MWFNDVPQKSTNYVRKHLIEELDALEVQIQYMTKW